MVCLCVLPFGPSAILVRCSKLLDNDQSTEGRYLANGKSKRARLLERIRQDPFVIPNLSFREFPLHAGCRASCVPPVSKVLPKKAAFFFLPIISKRQTPARKCTVHPRDHACIVIQSASVPASSEEARRSSNTGSHTTAVSDRLSEGSLLSEGSRQPCRACCSIFPLPASRCPFYSFVMLFGGFLQ